MRRSSLLFLLILGCSSSTPPKDEAQEAAIQKERSQLSPADQMTVAAQEWCVINTNKRLGSMGAPIKLSIKDQDVFICCESCATKAEANPEKTLAKLKELQAKPKP